MLSAGHQHARRRSLNLSKLLFAAKQPTVSACRYTSQAQRPSTAVVAAPPPPVREVIFSGIQPTGVPHLGNYLGALQQWVRIQNTAPAATNLIYSIVDLHAITTRQDPAQLRKWKRETLAILLAVGLDPQRSTIFFQSTVPAHTELMWILSCTASMGYLSRMTQWKSKLSLPDEASTSDTSVKIKLKLGLFSYPVLQAADVLVHRATQVPVGEDQVQHLEFVRECANNFNHAYGPVFAEPKTILSPAKRVMSLKEPNLKMSKSHEDPRSRILITDGPDEVRKKIRLALTDSTSGVSYDPLYRPGVANLLEIMGHLDDHGRSCHELAQHFSTLSMRDFKQKVADRISESLSDIRTRYVQIANADNSDYLDHVAARGAQKASISAEKTMTIVYKAIGL